MVHNAACVNLYKKHFGDKPIIGIEIGSMGGGWTVHILVHCPNVTKLHCIEPWKHFDTGYHEAQFKQEKHDQNKRHFDSKMKPYQDRVQIWAMKSDEAYKYIHELVDFVYIDGDHEYTQVYKDVTNFKKLVKKGGLLSGHDYGLAPGVKKAVDKLVPDVNVAEDFVWWKEM